MYSPINPNFTIKIGFKGVYIAPTKYPGECLLLLWVDEMGSRQNGMITTIVTVLKNQRSTLFGNINCVNDFNPLLC